jgi:hypothetical protein
MKSQNRNRIELCDKVFGDNCHVLGNLTNIQRIPRKGFTD